MSATVLGAYALLSVIVTLKIAESSTLSATFKWLVALLLWGFVGYAAVVLVRYYRRLPA